MMETQTRINNEQYREKNRSKFLISLVHSFKGLPIIFLYFIFLPTMIFGIFTWGFNPEDPQFRLTYYILALAPAILGLFVGAIIGKIFKKAHDFLPRFFSVLGIINAFICFLWLLDKFTITGNPAIFESEFIGWHWSDYYQVWIYCSLILILAVQSGLVLSYIDAFPHQQFRLFWSFIEGTLIFVFTWLMGSWIYLMLVLAIGELLCFSAPFLELNIALNVPLENISNVSPIKTNFFIKLFLPFLILMMGIFLGLTYITHQWGLAWIIHFFMIGSIAIIFTGISAKWLNSSLKKSNYLMIIGILSSISLVMWLYFDRAAPVSYIWASIIGLIVSIFLTYLQKLFQYSKGPFRRTFSLATLGLFFEIGICGGIAYFYYEPLGSLIVEQILFVLCGIAAIILLLIVISMRTAK